MSEEDEITLGAEAAQQVEQYMGFSGSADLNAYVDRIGQRLAKHSSRSHLVHEFHVVDMKEPNAFALPGGHIYVSRGLLAIMNSEDELAAVLGHEIGHVEGRHSAKQQTKSRGWIPLQILAGIGGAAASVVSPGLGGAVASMCQLPASLVLASYSRNQEKEADRFGQQYAAAEGWDPAALSATMDALSREQQLAGGGDPNQMSFLDSHPTTPERAREGREFASTLTVAPANRIAIDRTAFVGRLDGLVVGDAARGGVFIDRLFVHPELDFALSFPKARTYENGASAVLAYPKDESAVLALQVVAEGSDPAAVADEIDVQRLGQLGDYLKQTFAKDLAAGKSAKADNTRGNSRDFSAAKLTDGDRNTYWAADDGVLQATLEVDLCGPTTFDNVRIQEYIRLGRQIHH